MNLAFSDVLKNNNFKFLFENFFEVTEKTESKSSNALNLRVFCYWNNTIVSNVFMAAILQVFCLFCNTEF